MRKVEDKSIEKDKEMSVLEDSNKICIKINNKYKIIYLYLYHLWVRSE